LDNQVNNEEQNNSLSSKQSTKEWKLIEKMVSELGSEQKRSRRWGVFFKLLTFVYLFTLLVFFMGATDKPEINKESGTAHTAVIEVKGVIAADQEASADIIVAGLRNAFEDTDTKAVVLRINSPGGSPVQSGYIYDEIVRLKTLHDIPVYAVIADIGASGAYYIAAAADEIYADKASLVGSIGVVGSGFGFVEVLDKLGVERRTFTSGKHKGFLDPFLPLKDDEKTFWESVLKVTHKQFIEQVKKGRGDRLKDDDRLFSGLIWSGEQALEFGLIDGLGSTSYVAREVVGVEEIVDFTSRPAWIDKFAKQLGVSAGAGIAQQMGIDQPRLR
jgi:protease-4